MLTASHHPDNMGAAGAARLAAHIQNYWIEKGYPGIKTWIEKITGSAAYTDVHCVRSNMVRGFPPRS